MMEMMEAKTYNDLILFKFLSLSLNFYDRKLQQSEFVIYFYHFHHSHENQENRSTKTIQKNTYIILIFTIFLDLLYSNRIYDGSHGEIESIVK